LKGRFKTEPLYVDLSWAKTDHSVDLRHGRFRSATLQGWNKDRLDGDDVRRHPRNKRLASTAIAAILGFAVTAEIQRHNAVEQRDNARDFSSRTQIANGLRLHRDNDQLGALIWLAEVLRRDRDNP
jgi:hypothetical protein